MKNFFSPQARNLLLSVRDQPWGTTLFGRVRLKDPNGNYVCPVCMVANRMVGKWEFRSNADEAGALLGLSNIEVGKIVRAADHVGAYGRRELLRLIGGLREDRGDGTLRVKRGLW